MNTNVLLFAVAVIAVTGSMGDKIVKDYTQQMHCAKYADEDGNTQSICTGEPTYVHENRQKLRNRLNTIRKDGPISSGNRDLAAQYHYITNGPLPQCDKYSEDSTGCYLSQDTIAPDFLYNVDGEPRNILQDDEVQYQQQLTYARCYDYSYTCYRVSYNPIYPRRYPGGRYSQRSGPGHCFARFTTIELWAYDPQDDSADIVKDRFRVPYCCRCIILNDN